MNTVEWLKKRWLSVGIEKGDTLLLHSNIIRTLGIIRRNGYELSVNAILESFVQSVGKQGTLLFPLFNFDFTNGSGIFLIIIFFFIALIHKW